MTDFSASPIAWMEVLETGVPEIDKDHRDLIDLCNALTALMSGSGAWSAVVDAARDLADKCAAHFRSEETVLDKSEFPRSHLHKMQHRRIEARFSRLIEFMAGVDGGKPEHYEAAGTMRAALVDILFRHDLDYKSHLQHAAGR